MRSYRPVSRWLLVLSVVGFNPVQAFVAPLLHEATCRTANSVGTPATSSDRLPGIRPRRTSMAAASSGAGDEAEEPDVAKGHGNAPLAEATAAKTPATRDFGVLAATGATGAMIGWCLAHRLGMDLDLLGAFSGCLAAVGLLAQEGEVGENTVKVGRFALGAFDVASTVAASSDVPAKVAGTVGEEFLEVVEFTSGAVTKGYLDSLPEPNVRLEAEIAASKERVADLKGQLEKVTAALSEAKTLLLERKENKRIVDAAKSTASELAEAKVALAKKDGSITETLKLARQEKDTFDRDLKAAKAEMKRFREMVESRADMDDNFKALAEASDTLEQRVQEYEGRLRVLTAENDSIRADYSAEIKSMEMERSSMRDRISDLEASLSGTEARMDEQRDALERELAVMADALEERAGEANAATKLAAEMKAAVAKSTVDTAAAIEKAAKEAAGRAAKEEKARALEDFKAVKENAAAAQKAAVAAAAAKEAQAAAKTQAVQQKRMADEAIAREAAQAKGEAAAAAAAAAKKKAMDETAKKEAAMQKEQAALKAAAAEAKKKQQQEKERATRQAKEEQRASEKARSSKAKPAETVAKRVVAPKKRVEGAPAPAGGRVGVDAPTSREGLMKMTVKDLRVRCKGQGVPTTGKKVDLVDRLLEALVSA